MCGITGFINVSRLMGHEELLAIATGMADMLYNRGPNDSGAWVDDNTGIALGHRRLSIIDLSPEGHQPMHSTSGRYVVVFNGEIYNFKQLREELEPLGYYFRGHSDTEVLLAAVEHWGIEDAVKRFIGMFAFALWDKKKRMLYLVRDRLGIKPLYYGWLDKTFAFSSELKAFKKHPDFKGTIDRNSLTLLLRHNYIPTPYSIYENIYKLSPGTILTISCDGNIELSTPKTYWNIKEIVERGNTNIFKGTVQEAVDYLDKLLRDAIKMRMVADVPLGAFLSGGVDSSTVVALMQVQSAQPIKTFSIGFHESGYNEADHAKAVASHLSTNHTELYVSSAQALSVIPKLPNLYDEPFSDSSQIPTYLVAQLARQHVTVSLSGDGGDELFAGYNRYFWGRNIWQKIGWMPNTTRQFLAKVITLLPPHTWENIFLKLGPVLPKKIKQRNPGDKLHKLAEVLAVNSPEGMYHNLVSHWKNPAEVVIGAFEPPTVLTDRNCWANLQDFTQQMMYLDMVTYLPDDILTKVDRASMGVSLEARVPILDHRVVEFACQLPLTMKINGQGKWLLRQVLYRYVPKKLIERPKMGFGVPIDHWLRGPLREWAEELLNENRIKQEGYFNPEPIRKLWQEHLSGERNWQYYLWDILMFQAWLEKEKQCIIKV